VRVVAVDQSRFERLGKRTISHWIFFTDLTSCYFGAAAARTSRRSRAAGGAFLQKYRSLTPQLRIRLTQIF